MPQVFLLTKQRLNILSAFHLKVKLRSYRVFFMYFEHSSFTAPLHFHMKRSLNVAQNHPERSGVPSMAPQLTQPTTQDLHAAFLHDTLPLPNSSASVGRTTLPETCCNIM